MIGIGLVLGVTLLAVGIVGIVHALRIVQGKRSSTPMPYPVGLPWLTSRPTTAGTVLRIGQLYTATGLLMALYAAAMLTRDASTLQTETCITMADQLVRMQSNSALFAATLRRQQPHDSECAVRAADGTEWYWVRTERRNDAIGEAFNTHTKALERLGMALEPFTFGTRRAALGLAGSEAHHEPRILVEGETAIHTIIVRQPATDDAYFELFLAGFRDP